MSHKVPHIKLEDEELEFARNHIRKFYASDFFPDVPEYEAIWAAWTSFKETLKAKSVSSLGQPPLIMAAPKSGGGYRLVHQLQPHDAIAYTALAYKIAAAVEKRRASVTEEIVCSYRIALAEDGQFFDGNHDGYSTFFRRSSELADRHAYVLAVDIAGFFNHIYIHRLQNSIEQCGDEYQDLSTAIEEFLLNLNQRQSVGIPIGPAASIIFSEAVLIDVDEFVRTNFEEVEYVRYVDDFRIFSDSRVTLDRAYHELTSYLYRAHRLTLATGKSRLWESTNFKAIVLDPPEEAERKALQAEFSSLMIEAGTPYDDHDDSDATIEWDDAPADLRIEAINRLFQTLLNRRPLDLGLARHILRRSRRYGIRSILPEVIDNAGFLLPVFRDVVLYWKAVLKPSVIRAILPKFESLISTSIVDIPFARYWLRWLFALKPDFSESKKIEQFVMGGPPDMRAQALYARTNRRESWVKKNKDDWANLGSWDRRALILAGEALSTKERNVWMDSIERAEIGLLDTIVAKYVRSK
jgi:hypothetical protein